MPARSTTRGLSPAIGEVITGGRCAPLRSPAVLRRGPHCAIVHHGLDFPDWRCGEGGKPRSTPRGGDSTARSIGSRQMTHCTMDSRRNRLYLGKYANPPSYSYLKIMNGRNIDLYEQIFHASMPQR